MTIRSRAQFLFASVAIASSSLQDVSFFVIADSERGQTVLVGGFKKEVHCATEGFHPRHTF
jgi:hypothetical protein